MPLTATIRLGLLAISCASLIVTVAASAKNSSKEESGKKLRNVIITSFGEMPYEPMEGFVQSDVIPVNRDGEADNPTMDVALRTGFLVEDPNEKKANGDDTPKQYDDGTRKGKVYGEEELRAFKEKHRYADRKKTKRGSFQFPDQFVSPAQPSFDFNFRQHYAPYPPRIDRTGYNIDREYFGDLGEGWNLQDAEGILKGRNYNILTPHSRSFPIDLPAPGARELPPPMLPPGGLQFFPLIPFANAAFEPPRPPQGHPRHQFIGATYPQAGLSPRKQTQQPRTEDRQDDFLSGYELKDVFSSLRAGALSNSNRGKIHFSEDYLRGA